MAMPRFALNGAQFAIVLLALAAVPLVPPANGRMLVIPLHGGGEAAAIRAAREADALVVGSGPLHSAVVDGNRGEVVAAAARAGMITLSAPTGGCGAGLLS